MRTLTLTNEPLQTGRRPINIILWFIALVTTCLLGWFTYKIFTLYSGGDESFYVNQTLRLDEHSWYSEWAAGNPIGFTIPIWLIGKLNIPYLIAGRLLSLISLLAFIVLTYRYCKNRLRFPSYFPALISITFLVIFVTHRFITQAYSDVYFTLILSLVVFETISRLYEENIRFRPIFLLGLALGAMLLIRPTMLIVGPSILAAFMAYQIKRYGFKLYNLSLGFIFGFGFALGVILIQIPSFIEYGTFKTEYKDPSRGGKVNIKSTWMQRNCLSLYLESKGEKLSKGNHVSWAESDAYLAEHGPNSLPNSVTGRLFWQPKLVLTGMAEGLFLGLPKFLFRFTGFLWLLPFLLLLPGHSRNSRAWAWFLIAFLAINALFYSFLSLNFVEGRHYYMLMIVLVLGAFYTMHQLNPVLRHRFVMATVLLLVALLALGIQFEASAQSLN